MVEFSSKEELYQRVQPALRAKKAELGRLKYAYIKEVDIWNYLVTSRWRKSHFLMLSDIVNDILTVDCQALDRYVKEKLRQAPPSQVEII